MVTYVSSEKAKRLNNGLLFRGYEPTTAITISNNVVDGREIYSPGCDGKHYWVALFTDRLFIITLFVRFVVF